MIGVVHTYISAVWSVTVLLEIAYPAVVWMDGQVGLSDYRIGTRHTHTHLFHVERTSPCTYWAACVVPLSDAIIRCSLINSSYPQCVSIGAKPLNGLLTIGALLLVVLTGGLILLITGNRGHSHHLSTKGAIVQEIGT
jgi:hypothetical protein